MNQKISNFYDHYRHGNMGRRDFLRKLSLYAGITAAAMALLPVLERNYLETHPLSNGNVGWTGFCWGGAMTNQVAVNAPSLKAAVPYYGSVPPAERVPEIEAAIMAHYASDDDRINEGIKGFEEALKKAGKEYRIHIYEGTQHAFNNDTNPDRYHPEAAKLAWERTVAFFKEKLEPG